VTGRFINFVCAACAVLFVLFVAAGVMVAVRGRSLPIFSFGEHLHVLVDPWRFPEILVCNNHEVGPWLGRMTLGVSGSTSETRVRVVGAVEFPGLFFQSISWPGYLVWGFRVSLVYPLALFGLPPVMWWIARLRRNRKRAIAGFPVETK
jgi:hypothetical protein